MEKTKIVEFVKKYKTAIFLPIICLLQFLACFFYNFWIVATVFSVILLLISDFADMLCYTLFFQMFSSRGWFSLINLFVAAGLICIKYIYDLIKKREKFYKLPFILTVLICALYSSFSYKIDIHGIYQGSSLIVLFFLTYLIFVYRRKIKLQRCADFLICGILATAAISFLTLIFENSTILVFDGFNELKRLKLMTSNENSLSIYCSMSLSFYVTAILNKQGNIYKNIIFSIVAIIFGLNTLSKCFLVICLFITLYLFFMLIIKFKLKSFVYIIPIIIIMSLLCLIFKSSIGVTLERFFKYNDMGFFSTITTGRSILWRIYLDKITSSIPKMLFGVGFFNERIVLIGPHNFLIHIVYRMGFVGLSAIGVLSYYYYKESNKELKITLKNCLPILVFLMISMIENFI